MRNRRLSAALLGSLAIGVGALSTLARARPNALFRPSADIGALSPALGSPQRQAAEAGLARLTKRLSASASALHVQANRVFDTTGQRGLGKATIGDGFETYLVDPQALLSGKPLDQSLYGSGEWRFVVMANGKGIGLITVARMSGAWTMVEAGASELAGEITAVATQYAQQAPAAQLRFVRSQQAVADFIEVRSASTAGTTNSPVYVPLASARAALAPREASPLMPGSALSDAQLDDALRQRVQRGMRDLRFGH